MSRSINRPTTILAVIALAGMISGSQAGTTVMDVQLGGSFTGSITTPGVDTVEARFYAPAGATIRLTVQAVQGSSLKPTAVVKDSMGSALPGTVTQTLPWLPVSNLKYHFTVPATGRYTAEIGGSSGSGGFWAGLTGTPYQIPRTMVSGTVVDSLTSNPIVGVTVRVDGAMFATTDTNGAYSGQLDPGSYLLTFEAVGYPMGSAAITVGTTPIVVPPVQLTPDNPVTVTAGAEVQGGGAAMPGSVLNLTADVQAPPGTTVDPPVWTVEAGPATIGTFAGNGGGATATLGSTGEFKDAVIHHLEEPPVTADQLPENVPLPPGEFPAGLQDRLQVVGINPFALEEAAIVRLRCDVMTTLGPYSSTVEVHTELPFKVASGLRNTPLGIPVLLRAKEAASYTWSIVNAPAGSSAMLSDEATRHAYFTPDVEGLYQLEVADVTRGAASPLEVYVGTWFGVIVDQLDGRPVADPGCMTCHNDVLAENTFAFWKDTGHAEIFTDQLNEGTHYGPNCFGCHTVGFDPDVDNGGVDEAPDFQDFMDAGLINNPSPDNWTHVLENFPATARLANAQCESCHGPQNTAAHFSGALGQPRASISADVCATCHGEPLRHARFQQWQLSAHANYELAIDEGESGSCSRCHTGNGFLAWLPILLDDDPNTDPLDDITVTWSVDETHPQTCATCHDPHAPGSTSGEGSNATVRISGDTPPLIAGFTATDVGRGAICLTCHNSRRGLHNDEVFDTFPVSEWSRMPHGSAQADTLMGQNAYFVEVAVRGGHSMTPDTCVDCHMKATPPPDVLSYNLGGSNHTFFAEPGICAECHSPGLRPEDVQRGVESLLAQVKDLWEQGIVELMDALIAQGNTIGFQSGSSLALEITDVDDIASLELSESRGRQALVVELVGGGGAGPTAMTSVVVLDSGGMEVDELYEFADPALAKAAWNWGLFHNDGSGGVHNPFFANGALVAARNALVAIPSGSAALERSRSLRERPGVGVDRRSRARLARDGR